MITAKSSEGLLAKACFNGFSSGTPTFSLSLKGLSVRIRMDMDILLSLYEDDWTRRYLSLVGYTCLVYDYALTFDKEVDFIWRTPLTFTRAIFLLNRYVNLICQTAIQFAKLTGVPNHGSKSCDLPSAFTSTYIVFAMESIHFLVLLRAWALWGCDRRIALILIGIYSVYLLLFLLQAIFSSMSISIHTFQYSSLPEICVTIVPQKMWTLSLANICQDTAVFMVTMISLWRHSKATLYSYPTSPLFCLIRDAMVFYIAGLSFHGFGAIVCIIYPSNPKNVLFRTFALNLFTIAGQRFVLNLHGFAVQTYGSRTLSAEVDRQLRMMSGAQPLEWWSTGDT